MELKPGEIICPKCKGFKYKKYHEMNTLEHTYSTMIKCPKCHGTGKLDWVENVVGKKKKGTMVKPGVYMQESDFSEIIPPIPYKGFYKK